MALITTETAREFAAKANKIRWDNWRQRKLAEHGQVKPVAIPVVVPDTSFQEEMVTRTREQIERLQKKLDEQLDSDDLDTKAIRDITEAISKLEAVEQRMSNRPLPGSLRPNNAKPKRSPDNSPEPE